MSKQNIPYQRGFIKIKCIISIENRMDILKQIIILYFFTEFTENRTEEHVFP